MEELRIDKWLKVARIFKSRNEAVEAIEAGHVKLNGERTKPAKNVKAGDVLTVRKGQKYSELKIKEITTKSLSAKLARELYEIIGGNQEISEELKEMIKIIEKQERENRKGWKDAKENKKKRREMSKFKYGE
ncbi:MAG: RNA-binding S4 domain-containing protein [Brevinematales bacterium]|nr:RNA-binding S4 domain-containing protein [Brevinematales bacterium]